MASGFSQNTGSPRSTAAATSRGCSLVQVQTYTASTASSTASSLAIGSAPDACAKAAVRSGSASYTAAITCVGAGPTEALAVVGGDQPAAEEADPHRHVFCTVSPPSTGMTAPVMNDAAGSSSESVIWATSSGSP